MDELRGSWAVVAMEQEGRPVRPDGPIRVTFAGGWMTLATPGATGAARYVLDPVAEPRAVDFVYEYPRARHPLVLPSIYRVRGGELTLCVPLVSREMALALADGSYGEPRAERPGQFRTWPGAPWRLLAFEPDEGTP